MKYLLLAFTLLFGLSASAATVCIGPSATGSGSGADWNNLKAWSGTPARGDTWYLIDGSYGAHVFSVAVSGTTVITIKKATIADHGGVSTGWIDTNGDGQASFTGTVEFQSSYWMFDGVTGAMSRNQADYGFTCTAFDGPLRVYNTSSAISDVTIQHFSGTAPSGDVEKYYMWTSDTTQPLTRITMRYCLADGYQNFEKATSGGLTMTDWLSEYNMVLNGFGSATWHGEDFNNGYSLMTNWIIRFNWVENRQHSGGTGCIVALNHASGPVYVYGNVFKDMGYGEALVDGVNYTLTAYVYNNTFINCVNDYGHGALMAGTTGCVGDFRNNLIANAAADAINPSGGTISHNSYYNTTAETLGTSGLKLNADPFVSQSATNYHLAYATNAGVTLSSPYNVDLDGNTRGADGTWDRGAYEFVSGGGGGGGATISVKNLRVGP